MRVYTFLYRWIKCVKWSVLISLHFMTPVLYMINVPINLRIACGCQAFCWPVFFLSAPCTPQECPAYVKASICVYIVWVGVYNILVAFADIDPQERIFLFCLINFIHGTAVIVGSIVSVFYGYLALRNWVFTKTEDLLRCPQSGSSPQVPVASDPFAQ